MIKANQTSSVTLCYDPTMKAGVKIERKAMIRKIQLKFIRNSHLKKKNCCILKSVQNV